ncbi:MAG TPA: hypothetical protein VKY92_22905 [Verrucomicrobiae bacterium]|jgi:hypothetical protein|nr:hypothetical protein [Verrucomicrobiae bacterium]
MQALKFVCRTLVRLLTALLRLSHSVAFVLEQRRKRADLNGLEAERLDRIRNPSKYLGR